MKRRSWAAGLLAAGCLSIFLSVSLGEATARPELRGPANVKRVAVPRAAQRARRITRIRPPLARPTIDTVGSLGQDGVGYGFNRFSGQRYYNCTLDEGYGRTRPCDAGGDGGGGGFN